MRSLSFKKFTRFVRHILERYRTSHAGVWAASISFYSILSLPAVFTILLSVAPYVIEEQTLLELLRVFLPHRVLEGSLRTFLDPIYREGIQGSLIISFLIAFFSVGKIFSHLATALEEIWGISPSLSDQKKTILVRALNFFKKRIRGAVPLLILTLLLLVLTILNTLFHVFLPGVLVLFPGMPALFPLLASIVFILISATVCGLFFFIFSRKTFSFRQLSIGGFLTALLLFVGQWGLGMYFRFVDVGSGFGTLSSSIVLLVWLYYSTSIFLLGATAVCGIAPKSPSKSL